VKINAFKIKAKGTYEVLNITGITGQAKLISFTSLQLELGASLDLKKFLKERSQNRGLSLTILLLLEHGFQS